MSADTPTNEQLAHEALYEALAGEDSGWKAQDTLIKTDFHDCGVKGAVIAALNGRKIRRAPKTITLPEVTIQAPETEAPTIGTTCFVPDACRDRWFAGFEWNDTINDRLRLKNAQVYLKREHAIAAARARVPALQESSDG